MSTELLDDPVLSALTLKRSQLEQDVVDKQQSLDEAQARLSAFKANALSALGAASGSKSAQKQRAERQSVVKTLLDFGLSRAEIVRRTGINDHLVGYDISCIRRNRPKQGTKKVFQERPSPSSTAPDIQIVETAPITLPPPPPPAPPPADKRSTPETPPPTKTELQEKIPPLSKDKVSPFIGKPDEQPLKFGQIRPGCSVSRSQLKAAMKDHLRGDRATSTFVTTVDNNHAHTAKLDRQGDGKTVKDDTEHGHRICNFELIEGSHDHTHGLTLEEGIEA